MNVSYEEQLSRNGFLLKQTKGVSMEPMLRQYEEESLIRALDREPRKYDVVLFKRSGGEYVLHRVIGREGDTFLIRGDNCMGTERVKREQILGILEGFYRGETYVNCATDREYLRYSRRIVASFPLRMARSRVRSLGSAVLRKLHIK